MKKKLYIALLVCALALASFAFVACGGSTDSGSGTGGDNTPSDPAHTHNYTWVDNLDGTHKQHCQNSGCDQPDINIGNHDYGTSGVCICGKTKPVEDITLEKFVSNYPQLAQDFVEDVVRPSVVSDKEIKAERWSIKANDDNRITEVNMVYTYSVDETNRAIELASATLKNPILMQDIVDRKVVKSDLEIDRTTIFEFDAKLNYDKQPIADALYSIMGENSATKLLSETQISDDFKTGFDYLVSKDNQYLVKTCEITKGDGSDSALLENIEYGNIFNTETKATYNFDGTEIYNQGYTLENIETEIPGPGPDVPITDPVTAQEIIEALEQTALTSIVNRCLSGLDNINLENVSEGTWYVTKDTDGKITGAEYTFTYKVDGSIGAFFSIGKVEFNSPISSEDLKNGNIGNATYTRSYRTDYNYTIQEDKVALTNAICNKVFGEKEGATRYIVEGGTTTDATLGMQAGIFKVVEISGNEVKEKTINIKIANSDQEYINNLENDQNYRITDEKSYEISGEEVKDKEETQAQTYASRSTKVRYIISFDGMDDEFFKERNGNGRKYT